MWVALKRAGCDVGRVAVKRTVSYWSSRLSRLGPDAAASVQDAGP